MQIKFRVFFIIFLNTLVSVNAQEKTEIQKLQDDYDRYKKETIDDFDSYRNKINKEFAAFMKQEWDTFQVSKGTPVPKSPEPKVPPVKKDSENNSQDNLMPYDKIVPLPPSIAKQAQPIEPILVIPKNENQLALVFTFFSIPCSVSWNDSLKFNITPLHGDVLASIWTKLSGSAYNNFLLDCINLRSNLLLCDWGYVKLISQITEKIYGSSITNEAIFLQMYVLSQTGYKIRIAKSENGHLVLLLNIDNEIYDKKFILIENSRFYMMDSDAKQIQVLNIKLPNEQPISMRIEKEQLSNNQETAKKSFVSKNYPIETVLTGSNKDLIHFYETYPQCDWKIYANTPLSKVIKKNLYPVLLKAINGKTDAEAANLLINFIQTAFQYKTDEEQFGHERTFFSDELFFYPYSDCEDRAILFSILVKDLLHLKVVLLHYPTHMATAVHFNEDIKGDYLMINNIKYLVCDPTYIGAPIGDAMPQFKSIEAEIIIL